MNYYKQYTHQPDKAARELNLVGNRYTYIRTRECPWPAFYHNAVPSFFTFVAEINPYTNNTYICYAYTYVCTCIVKRTCIHTYDHCTFIYIQMQRTYVCIYIQTFLQLYVCIYNSIIVLLNMLLHNCTSR